MVSDASRRELFLALEQHLGPRPAETLMELLPPVGWADVARRSDIAELRGEMAELRGEMAELRAELRGAIAELRTELKGDIAMVRDEMAELRAQMSGLLPKLLVAQLGTTFAFGGLLIAAVALVG